MLLQATYVNNDSWKHYSLYANGWIQDLPRGRTMVSASAWADNRSLGAETLQGQSPKAFCPFSYKRRPKVMDLSDSSPPFLRQTAYRSPDQPLLLVSGWRLVNHARIHQYMQSMFYTLTASYWTTLLCDVATKNMKLQWEKMPGYMTVWLECNKCSSH